MSWMKNLYDVYNARESKVGDGAKSLCPAGHTVKQFHVEAHIDEHGNWLNNSREIKDKSEMLTIIPCTSSSASRTSSPAPAPLFDDFGYVAGDFGEKFKKHFNLYIEQLENWSNNCEKIRPLFIYLQKATLMADLKREGVISEKLLANNKTAIRFIIQYEDESPCPLWEDSEVRENWIEYQKTLKPMESEEDVFSDYCFILGEEAKPATYNPKNIRHQGDGTKLISTREEGYFKWSGRFTIPREAYSVSDEVMQKAHSALRWLISEYGERSGDQVVLAFGTGGKKTSPITKDFDYNEDDEYFDKIDTEAEFSKKFNRALKGYGCELDGADKTVIIGLDAATTGRLSIFYYSEMPWKELIENIISWHWQASWQHTYKKKTFFDAPSPDDIIKVVYGEKATDELKKNTIKRLLPCIANGAKLPVDIMRLAVNNAGNAVDKDNWIVNKKISIACSLIRKYYFDTKKEELKVALDLNDKRPSYLFGRALAYFHQIEWTGMDENERRIRRTNAQRLMSGFAQHPAKTVGILQQKIQPYMDKIHKKCGKVYHEKGLLEVIDKIGDNMTNTPLDELYLVGYSSQMIYFFTGKNDKNESDKENEE
ncbi:type I-C CRISPR-associated protein Cas8c/Csd1 [Clostridia bacterium]|nr:type I-C CRISPR-associated protein Cas8c/Csd1 [Clostridia bacterium]